MKSLLFLNLIFPLSVLSLTIVVVIVGLVLVILASTVLAPEKPNHVETTHHPMRNAFQRILRDIGIAFLVAAVVTIVYGSTLDFNRVSDAVSMMIGENVPQSVWEEIKTQFLGRSVMRGNFEARWTIQQDSSLPSDQAVMKVHIAYDLYGLKSQPFDYTIRQALGNIHLRNAEGTLPRFDRVTVVGGKSYSGEELNSMVKDGLLTMPPITLKSWKKTDAKSELTENSGIRIIFERSEIINIPGTYNLVLAELTKGVKLEIEHSDSIQHELKEWFDSGSKGYQPAAGGKYYNLDGVVLPGQSVSVQYWLSDQPSITSSGSPASSSPAKRMQ